MDVERVQELFDQYAKDFEDGSLCAFSFQEYCRERGVVIEVEYQEGPLEPEECNVISFYTLAANSIYVIEEDGSNKFTNCGLKE